MTDNTTPAFTPEQAAALAINATRGQSLGNWIATTVLLGHASPGSTLDYVHVEPWTEPAFIKDFVAWTSGRKHLAPGCEDRLREWGTAELRRPDLFAHLDVPWINSLPTRAAS